MEIIFSSVAIILILFVEVLLVIKYLQINKRVNAYNKIFGQGMAERIKELDPKKKYIIALPASMSDTDFDTAFGVMRDHLELGDADTHIVIMHGDLSMVEFS